ncbi:unnamed protein product, partial [Urochloa humidicola]
SSHGCGRTLLSPFYLYSRSGRSTAAGVTSPVWGGAAVRRRTRPAEQGHERARRHQLGVAGQRRSGGDGCGRVQRARPAKAASGRGGTSWAWPGAASQRQSGAGGGLGGAWPMVGTMQRDLPAAGPAASGEAWLAAGPADQGHDRGIKITIL